MNVAYSSGRCEMKISDLSAFYEDTLSVLTSDDDLTGLLVGHEVSVIVPSELDEMILTQGELTVGCSSKNSEYWVSAADNHLWVVQSVKGAAIQLKGIKYLPSNDAGALNLSIAVDEKIRDDVASKAGFDNPSIEEVSVWLAEQFLTSDGGVVRAFQASYHDASSNEAALTLIGKDFSLVLEVSADSTPWVRQLRPKPRNQNFSLVVLSGNIRFEDATVAVKLASSDEVKKLERLRNDQKSYVALWEKYDQVSNRLALDQAKQAGFIRYLKQEREIVSDTIEWRFFFAEEKKAQVDSFCKSIKSRGNVELEIHHELPDWLGNEVTVELGRTESSDTTLKAKLLKMNSNHLVLELEKGKKPNSQGYIYLSLAGDQAISKRRVEARDRIDKRRNGLSQLAPLIEGLSVPTARYRNIKPLSVSAKSCFKGEPTDKQKDALDVALNTPDIALILGPPGTGKTQIISAIQKRLAEEAHTEVGSDVLVSSFQHDAVDNVVARSEVFGLPAIRVGKQARASAILQGWLDKQKTIVEKALADQQSSNPCFMLIKSLRTNLAILICGELSEPEFKKRMDELRNILGRLSREHHFTTSSALRIKLEQAAAMVETDTDLVPTKPNENRRLLMSARGLRVTKTAFLDDGPDRVFDFIHELTRSGKVISNDQVSLLDRLADEFDEPKDDDLFALRVLRAEVLEAALPDYRPRRLRTTLNEELLNVLKDISDEISGQVSLSSAGVVDVLSEYVDVLSFQKGRVSDTLEKYTTTLGATCQGAVSKAMVTKFGGDDISFGTVIIDEAARANPLDLFIPMSLARRRIILVGDHYQLPQMLDPEVEAGMLEAGMISDDDKRILGESLFKKLYDQLKSREAEDGVRRTVMLDTQFRMHPALGRFVSEQFYEARGEAPVLSGLSERELRLSLAKYSESPMHWVDVPHSLDAERRKGTSWERPLEAQRAAELAAEIVESDDTVSVGVITFYAPQRERIFGELRNKGLCSFRDGEWEFVPDYRTTRDGEERIRVGSVDAFQGKEFDVVILSMTRSNQYVGLEEDKLNKKFGFLRKPERLNVAFSRAKGLLIAVGDKAMFSSSEAKQALPSVHKYCAELCGGSS